MILLKNGRHRQGLRPVRFFVIIVSLFIGGIFGLFFPPPPIIFVAKIISINSFGELKLSNNKRYYFSLIQLLARDRTLLHKMEKILKERAVFVELNEKGEIVSVKNDSYFGEDLSLELLKKGLAIPRSRRSFFTPRRKQEYIVSTLYAFRERKGIWRKNSWSRRYFLFP